MKFVLTVVAACCAFASACGEAVRVYGEAGGVVRMRGSIRTSSTWNGAAAPRRVVCCPGRTASTGGRCCRTGR